MRLAEELMEFALQLGYADPQGGADLGPEAGELGIVNFDNIDDLDGFQQDPGGIEDITGTLHPSEYQVFTRSVSVTYGSETVAELGGAIPGLTVTVTVEDGKGTNCAITRFVPEPTQ
jgi:hypothetical protein